MGHTAITPWLAILIVLGGGSLAFGQAGSIGGVVGKTDKSIAGGGAAPETSSRSKAQRPSDKGDSSKSSPISVAGPWSWTADCPNGHWDGGFDLVETSRGQFNGSFSFNGRISDGRVNGTSVSFTRTHLTGVQYWRGQLAGGRIKGTLSGGGNCSWEATKK